jgi:hypothetical protein
MVRGGGGGGDDDRRRRERENTGGRERDAGADADRNVDEGEEEEDAGEREKNRRAEERTREEGGENAEMKCDGPGHCGMGNSSWEGREGRGSGGAVVNIHSHNRIFLPSLNTLLP